ncbi:transcriptional regulator [Chryseobacterium lathyri]|uniref:Transcriptional regulator n=2 Tax=Chryseobacterium group TaxID=2782232 RepID=A0A511Y917_9FLAO|nr:transcriptional regulator [Chryseobacterium lathyri]
MQLVTNSTVIMSNITYFSILSTESNMETPAQPKVLLLKATGDIEFPEDFQLHYHTHIYCQRGNASFIFNGKPVQCKQGEFIFWLADSKISDLSFSKNFAATVLFIDNYLLTDNFPSLNISIDAIVHHRVDPLLRPDKKNKERILKNFQSLYIKSLETANRFYDEILKLQMRLFLLEMWDIFIDQLERRSRSLESGTLYERFIKLVEVHCMKRREVQFYSSLLNITPKYLNQICKTNTGITASEWIQRYTKDRLIFLLGNKTLNISEIADQMGFSSHSFFTRYVKNMLGISPSEFRNRL